jgi:hypothetical protein
MNADPTLMLAERTTTKVQPLTGWRKYVHLAIIANFVMQLGYASFQVFVVMAPEGHIGPMFGAAMEMPHDLMMIRRMYALEGWVAFGGLALYLALTEMMPRMRA